MSGAVLTPFSGDTLLFQPTMGDWRVHAGTDFSAEAGETVLALTDGTVQQIAEDGLYGTCEFRHSPPLNCVGAFQHNTLRVCAALLCRTQR